jgi:hypothetical protein
MTSPALCAARVAAGKRPLLEIAGRGMVHPNVFTACGVERSATPAAFGGDQRLAMLRWRHRSWLFFENDLRFLGQFMKCCRAARMSTCRPAELADRLTMLGPESGHRQQPAVCRRGVAEIVAERHPRRSCASAPGSTDRASHCRSSRRAERAPGCAGAGTAGAMLPNGVFIQQQAARRRSGRHAALGG